MPRWQRALLPGRRGFLLAGLGLAAPGLARAGTHDGAFRRILATGRIRFGSGIWMAQLPNPPAAAPDPPQDPFHAALAGRIAATLGLRHSVTPPTHAFETMARLLNGELDVALGPMLNRLTARRLMFTPPYAELETVVLSAHPARRRTLAQWGGMRLGLLDGFVPHLASLGFGLEDVRAAEFQDLRELEAALVAGALDAVITTNVTARSLMARHPERGFRIRTPLTPHLHGAGVRFGEHELLRALAEVLQDARADGEIARLFHLHTGGELPPLPEGF